MYLGTFDISILELGDGVFEVKSTNGNTHLGGDDFDKKIIDWLADEFKNDEGIDLRKDPMAHQRLKEAAEKAKIELSASTQAEINLPYITAVDGMPKHLVKTLTRAKFEQLIDSLIQDSIDPCRKALEDANLKPSDIDEVLLVGGSTRVPAVQEAVKKFFGKEPSKNVNPDEAVAVGAAIQGGILAGEVNDVLLLDVTPLSLGIETMGGVMTKLVDANTTIPTRKSQIFSTAEDNQPAVDIHVLQGERPMARDNKTIGIFKLDGIAPAMRGVPQIEVTFDIDANGILNVSATDKGTGKEQHITIDNKNSLTPEEIEKAKADAEKYKEEDEKRQKEAQEINNAEQFIYAVEKSIKDEAYKDKFTEEDKTALNEKIESTKKILENKNVDEIKTAMEELHKVYDPIIERIYKEANPQPEGGAAGTEAFNNMFGDNNPFANAGK